MQNRNFFNQKEAQALSDKQNRPIDAYDAPQPEPPLPCAGCREGVEEGEGQAVEGDAAHKEGVQEDQFVRQFILQNQTAG